MRIEGTLRSPVNTCITDANSGRVTINAYGIEKYVINNYNINQNKNGTAWVLIKEIINKNFYYKIWKSLSVRMNDQLLQKFGYIK